MLQHDNKLWASLRQAVAPLVHTKPAHMYAKKKQAKRMPKVQLAPYVEPEKFRSMVRLRETSKNLVHYFYQQIK